MNGRSYSGPALDGTVQTIDEAPHWQDDLDEEADAVAYATDPEAGGQETTENVPVLEADDDRERPDVAGQSTLADWSPGGRR